MRLVVEALGLTRGDRVLTRDLSFTIEPGEAVALTAPNGAGKTTLLRAMAGLVRPTAGSVRHLSGNAPLELEAARARMHWVGWQDGVKNGRTARAEARFWACWAGGEPADGDRAMARLGLDAVAELDVRRLSVGQRRRLALSRLVATRRSLWLLDEPMSALDAGWRAQLGRMMAEHLAEGGSLIAAVHDPLPVPARNLTLGGTG